MTDRVSKEKRSEIMRAVKGKNTGLESIVSNALWNRGIRFRKNVSDLPGKPDIAIKKYKFVLFIDSCFWHGCDDHCRVPKTNKDYWLKKINRNIERDVEVTDYYLKNGWTIKRVWEHEVSDDFESFIKGIVNDLEKSSFISANE